MPAAASVSVFLLTNGQRSRGHFPMANGITSPGPHLEHFHRRARATTVVHGLCWAMSSSIGQRCLWPQPLQWAPTVAILRWSWRKAGDASQASRETSHPLRDGSRAATTIGAKLSPPGRAGFSKHLLG